MLRYDKVVSIRISGDELNRIRKKIVNICDPVYSWHALRLGGYFRGLMTADLEKKEKVKKHKKKK